MYKNKSSKTRQYQLYYRYAEAIYNWVNNNYAAKEEKMRNRLNDVQSDSNIYITPDNIPVKIQYVNKISGERINIEW